MILDASRHAATPAEAGTRFFSGWREGKARLELAGNESRRMRATDCLFEGWKYIRLVAMW
jgi:hypothetical protein